MRRLACLTVCGSVFLVGCQEPTMEMMEMKKPSPAPELAKLERMVGNWDGTWEMLSPKPEEGAEPMSGTSTGKFSWTMGGMFLMGAGVVDIGEGKMMNYVEYWTWDPQAKKYRSWFFSDWGESGESTFSLSADGNSMKGTFAGMDGEGHKKSGGGELTWVDNNTMEGTWHETGPMGNIKMKWTSKRK